MNTLKTLTLSLSAALAATTASAAQSLTCSNANFPQGIGSTLELTLTNGQPTHAELALHDQGNVGPTDGEYDVTPETFNEDGTPVHYLSWYAGAGQAGGGVDHLNLIPRKLVIYAFDENLKHNNTLFVGVINWVNGDKVEKHFVYTCK